MQIIFNSDVNTGSFRYEAGQGYDVDKAVADRFVAQGVARYATGDVPGNGVDSSGGLAASPATLAPSVPVNVLAQASNASVSVQWLAGPGRLPDQYVVTLSNGQTTTVAATARRQSVSLASANGVSVTATVRAVSLGLTSAASLPSNSVTPTALPSSILPVTRGLEMWWSAGQVTGVSNGASLATMTDFSGNGYNAVGQGGGGTWVSAWSNGKPAVSLNGSSQYYHTLASALYGGMRKPDFTVYALISVAGTATAAGRVLSLERGVPTADPSGCFAVGVSAGGGGGTAIVQGFNNGTPFAGASFATGDIANNTPIRVAATGPGAMRVNGSAVSGSFFDGRRAFGAGAPWCFGAMYGGGYGKYSNVSIAEVVIFSEVHTAAEIAAMETYLSTRA